MPADNSLSQEPSARHSNGSAPYPCSASPTPPGSNWSIDYGYCRTSLDWHGPNNPQGTGDPRCPADCQHKAPIEVAIGFIKRWPIGGAMEAAAWARSKRK